MTDNYKRKIPIEDFTKIGQLYQNGTSVNDIAVIYNCSKMAIYKVLEKLNIVCNQNKIEFDLPLIDDDFAWLLGLYYTDGCIFAKPGCRYLVALCQKEHEILFKAKSIWIEKGIPESRLIFQNDEDCSQLKIHGESIVKYMIGKGCVPHKTKILEYPKWLTTETEPSFARGLFDGDGHLAIRTCYKRSCKNFVVQFTSGSESFIERIADLFYRIAGNKSSIRRNGDRNCFMTGISGKRAMVFAEWIYNGSNDKNRMSRKFQVYRNAVDYYLNRPVVDKRSWKIEEIKICR